jgi:hypothetical protein
MTPGELKILMALDKLANNQNNYKSIKGVFTIDYTPPPFNSYVTNSSIRSNELDRNVGNYESASIGTGYYITLKVLSSEYPDGLGLAPFSYQFDTRDIDVIIGPGYDTTAYPAFTIKKQIENTTYTDDTFILNIYSKTLDNFGVDPSSGDVLGEVPFEIRFYNLVPYTP